MSGVAILVVGVVIAILLRLGLRRSLGLILFSGSKTAWDATHYMEENAVTFGLLVAVGMALLGAVLLFYPKKRQRQQAAE